MDLRIRGSHGKLYNGCVRYSSSVRKERVGLIMSVRSWTKGYDHLNFHFCTADDSNNFNNTLPIFSL